VLEKDEEDQLDRYFEERQSITYSQGEEYYICNYKKKG
jgi:hypothetical protein